MIELYQLKQLVTIAEVGTISKAAEVLLISQPALTRSIQRLEEELDILLFDRKKNKITLNENGQLAVQYAKKVLSETDQMVKRLQDFDRSKKVIIIGSCAPAPTWALTTIFHKLFDMQVVSELNAHKNVLLEGLANHHYSIVVLNEPFIDERYECVELFEEKLNLSVPPEHPLALSKHIAFQDLDGESVLLFSKIGFWNEVCLKMIPNSHLLIQEDSKIFNELTKASSLPNFISNINMLREKQMKNRVILPIVDKEATAKYYAIFKKSKRKLFELLEYEMKHLDWGKTLD